MRTSPTMTVVTGHHHGGDLSRCRQALSGHRLLALSCKEVTRGQGEIWPRSSSPGSRKGEISLIQLSTPEECFLLDVQGKTPKDPVVEFAKEILEDENVCKIVHDVRGESDALITVLGIKLRNVHDIQVVRTLPFPECRQNPPFPEV